VRRRQQGGYGRLCDRPEAAEHCRGGPALLSILILQPGTEMSHDVSRRG